MTVEVGGKRLEVVLPAGLGAGSTAAAGADAPAEPPLGWQGRGAAAGGDALTSPMQGTIVKVAVEEGQQWPRATSRGARGDEDGTAADAHKAGTITGLQAEPGASVTAGAVVCTITDG